MTDVPLSANLPDDPQSRPWFFCGIGGSGMLPLATILSGMGAEVAGSDRSFDQGRTPAKFDWLKAHGFELYPQDGSGMTRAEQILVASAAVEDTIPEVVRAKELGALRVSRAELLAHLFNRARTSLAVGGTSGKSTVTAMLGHILFRTGRDPTIMNGAVMKNFASPEMPFASARVGHAPLATGVFVSEVDESDGSIALYRPTVSVLLNVSLDHKSIEELRALFAAFLRSGRRAVINFDDVEARHLSAPIDDRISFAVDHPEAMIGIEPGTIDEHRDGIEALLVDRREDVGHPLRIRMPGRHNLSNALAAIAASTAVGVEVHDAAVALDSFTGIARRFDIVGTSQAGVTVIDDFGHNPEKVRATLRTLKAHEGRVIAFFQPHGFGPLRQMGDELAQVFARELSKDDTIVLCDPVYFGGTVDCSEGSERIVDLVRSAGGSARYYPSREECGRRIVEMARPGDRVVVMGARDDTLSQFAQDLLTALP